MFDIGLGESRPQLDRFPEHLPGAYQVGREAVRAVERVGRRPPRQALAEVKAGRGIIRVEHHGPVVQRDRLVIALGQTGQMGQPRVGRRIVRGEPLRFVKMLRGFGAAILIEVRQQIPQPKENLLLLHGCDLRDIVDRGRRFRHHVAQVLPDAVMGRPPSDLDPRRAELGKADRVVGRRQGRLGEIAADLALRHIERRDAIDIADMIAAELQMHQAGDRLLAFGAAIKFDPLDQRRGAIAHPDDRDPDFCHPNLLEISPLALSCQQYRGT